MRRLSSESPLCKSSKASITTRRGPARKAKGPQKQSQIGVPGESNQGSPPGLKDKARIRQERNQLKNTPIHPDKHSDFFCIRFCINEVALPLEAERDKD